MWWTVATDDRLRRAERAAVEDDPEAWARRIKARQRAGLCPGCGLPPHEREKRVEGDLPGGYFSREADGDWHYEIGPGSRKVGPILRVVDPCGHLVVWRSRTPSAAKDERKVARVLGNIIDPTGPSPRTAVAAWSSNAKTREVGRADLRAEHARMRMPMAHWLRTHGKLDASRCEPEAARKIVAGGDHYGYMAPELLADLFDFSDAVYVERPGHDPNRPELDHGRDRAGGLLVWEANEGWCLFELNGEVKSRRSRSRPEALDDLVDASLACRFRYTDVSGFRADGEEDHETFPELDGGDLDDMEGL